MKNFMYMSVNTTHKVNYYTYKNINALKYALKNYGFNKLLNIRFFR